MRPTIRFATSEEDRERVYRFRYQVYVEEMLRKQTYADPVRRWIEEPFDATGYLLMAEQGDQLVGTLRTNFASETDFSYYPELFSMNSVGPAFPEAVSLSTKFMIAPNLRAGTLAVRLARVVYELGRVRGIRHDFIDCNAHLEAFFTGLGYRRYSPHVEHPEYGRVLPLRLDIEDRDYLRCLGSPFARDRGWGGDLQIEFPTRPGVVPTESSSRFPTSSAIQPQPQAA